MFIEKNKKITIYFGDAQHSVSVQDIAAQRNTPALQNITQLLKVDQVVILQQNHGVDGMLVDQNDAKSYYFQPAGDYLVTQRKNCGLGVVTGDCLPIVIYDPITHTVAIIHAGWKGLLAGVVQTAVQDMIAKIGIAPENLELHLGPAARPCCYEVQQDFIDQFLQYAGLPVDLSDEAFHLRIACYGGHVAKLGPIVQEDHTIFIQINGKTYFDSRAFIIVLARSLGIKQEKIYTRYNVCTICTVLFCSYRREKEKARRQVTIVCLH